MDVLPAPARDLALLMATSVRLPFNQLDDRVRRTPVVLLEVSELTGRKVPEAVPDFFDAVYGDDFASFTIAIWEVPHRQWLVDRLAPARPDGVSPVGGLYLFLGGRAACYHRGYQPAAGVELFAFAASAEQESDARAREILDVFAPVAHAFLPHRVSRPHSAPPPRPSQAPPPTSGDITYDEACRLLGVSGHEPLDEIEKAARKKQVMNHPDRVANLDPELGRLANERFRAMGLALDIIRRRRGG
jgi:DnaJ-domain-containing protein 1